MKPSDCKTPREAWSAASAVGQTMHMLIQPIISWPPEITQLYQGFLERAEELSKRQPDEKLRNARKGRKK